MTSIEIAIVFFIVGLVAVTPVLYYYYKRNPNPRFRPPVGEMAMISLFALMLVGGGSYFMGTVLTSNPNFESEAPEHPTAQPKKDRSRQDEQKKSDKKDSPFPF